MVELTQETIWEKFREVAEKLPDKRFLVYLGKAFTYSELNEAAESLAASLHMQGLRKGDKAVLYLHNIPQVIIAWLGLQRLGCVPVPISPVYTPVDIKYMINDSESETIFCMDTNFGYVDEIFSETCLKRVIVTTFVEFLPWLKRTAGRGFRQGPFGTVQCGGRRQYFFFYEAA